MPDEPDAAVPESEGVTESTPPAGFFTLARSPAVVTRALKVSGVVGTLLVMINHGDSILAATFSAQNLAQSVLTYFVPYAVSTWSAESVSFGVFDTRCICWRGGRKTACCLTTSARSPNASVSKTVRPAWRLRSSCNCITAR